MLVPVRVFTDCQIRMTYGRHYNPPGCAATLPQRASRAAPGSAHARDNGHPLTSASLSQAKPRPVGGKAVRLRASLPVWTRHCTPAPAAQACQTCLTFSPLKIGCFAVAGGVTSGGVADLYIVDFGGDDDEKARREAERDAERSRLHSRYAHYLVARAAIDESAAQRVIAALFDPHDTAGRRCQCGCHPSLSSQHGDGFDCRCTWDEARQAEEARRREEFWDSLEATELRAEHHREEEAIAAWLTGQPGVDARRISSIAPEQWKGSVDGHSFYFRERGGCWRIELDIQESGRFARRLVRVAEDGGLITEPVPVMEGEVIAEGLESQLGATATEHIAFIVRTIRDHLWGLQCDHAGALFYCPKCGHRMTGTA